MSADLVFMMGEFEAKFPTDRQYAKNHMWAQQVDDSWRVGFSAYAVRLLQDVYFLDLTIEPTMVVAVRQEIGSVESKKAESSLYSPLAGTIQAINDNLMADPSGINVDKYGDGWMFQITPESAEALSVLLSPTDYMEHLAAAWKVAQRTIKGQANA